MELQIDPARTAVLSMDVQAGLVWLYARDTGLVERAAEVLHEARRRKMRVIHVRVGFRPGLPEASPRNMLLSSIRNSVLHQQLFEGQAGAIHPALGPEGAAIVITKSRVSAFTGTDLEVVLRAGEIDTLVLFGIATSGVVLSTALEAADRDYRLVVIRDCCADLDADLHACLLDKLLPRLAAVVTAGEFMEACRAIP